MSPADRDGAALGGSVLESDRVVELYRHADPDAAQPPEIDDIVLETAAVAGVPMATLNLIDTERQCPVVTTGFAGSVTPRREAMCSVTLELGTFVYVRDARDDPRFAHSPWVDGRLGSVRFYASAPLVTRQGFVIGTLCAFDIEPHELSEAQVAQLQTLAARAVRTYERERLDCA